MAVPTTLPELATEKRDAAKANEAAARLALVNNGKDLAKVKQNFAKVVAEIAVLTAEINAIRDALAKVATRADGEALLIELEQKTIALRAKQNELLSLEREQALRQAANDRASVEVSAASSALNKVEAELADVSKKDKPRQAWKASLGLPPLDTLRADANAALNTPPENDAFLAAKARIAGDFPAELLERARARRAHAKDRITNLRKPLQAAEEAGAAKTGAAFRGAEANLGDYVLQGKQRFDQARQALSRIADANNSPLTDEQRARIEDPDIVADGVAAAAKEKAGDDARADLEAKQATLDAAIIKARATDIDADPAADAAVQIATTARDTAQTALDDAEDEYTPDLRKDLDTWEAAVPNSTWRLLDEFEESTATLTTLKDLDPATLVTSLNTTESALVAAQLASDKELRKSEFVAAQIAQNSTVLAFEIGSLSRRKFGALRGD